MRWWIWLAPVVLLAAERPVAPTFLKRHLPDVAAKVVAPGCRYRAVFGAGDSDAGILKGVARFGEFAVDSGGTCPVEAYPGEEQAYVVVEGACAVRYGEQQTPLRRHDFFYVPPGLNRALSGGPCRVVVMGFKMPAGAKVAMPAKPLLANIDDVPKQVVGNHPPSTLYQLLMGDVGSKRDRLAAAHILTSLFVMEIAPGGTNTPHHHEREEEIYLVLEGQGQMVAGGGTDGVEGRHPARAGDAYFFRLNCTVGFYNGNAPGTGTARILAVRSLFPFGGR